MSATCRVVAYWSQRAGSELVIERCGVTATSSRRAVLDGRQGYLDVCAEHAKQSQPGTTVCAICGFPMSFENTEGHGLGECVL